MALSRQKSPSKTNHAADSTSRYPAPYTSVSALTICDQSELLFAAAISSELEDVTLLSWDLLRGRSNMISHLFFGNFQPPFPILTLFITFYIAILTLFKNFRPPLSQV